MKIEVLQEVIKSVKVLFNMKLEKIKNKDTWIYIFKRIVYIASFIGLCLIDQMIGSMTGYIQYGYKNYTGIIIGCIILTAYKLRDFVKIPYLIWIVVFFLFRQLAMDGLKEVIYNDIELETNLWGIFLYGILLIRIFYLYVIEKKKIKMNWKPFYICIILLIGMSIIRIDYAWPKALLGTFLLLYLTDFQEKDLNNLFSGMMEGVIIGFFIIQIQAWLYRPYDMVRYEGMYSHPNMNALLYLCAYCAVLCKWYLMKLKRTSILLRMFLVFLAGLIIGTMFYTGSRTAFITAIVLTVIFLIFQVFSCRKRKLLEFLIDGIVLVISIAVSILPAYWLIRYIPAYKNEPLYFETDYARDLNGKIKKDDPVDSEKYIELDEAAGEVFERYLWFLDEKTYVNVMNLIQDFSKSFVISLKVEAEENYIGLDEAIKINLWDGKDNNIKQYINPRTGKIADAGINSRVSNAIMLHDMRYVIVSSDSGFWDIIGWRFLDVEGNIVTYGRYVDGEKEQIITIPQNAKYFQFTWDVDTNLNLKVEFTNEELEHANVKVVELGTDSEHPLRLSENQEGVYDVRLDIYKYFINRLKLVGEKNNIQGIWICYGYQATHCHNVFLQIAYDFGVIIGVIFILLVFVFYIRVIIGLRRRRSGSWYYRLFVCTMYTTLFVVFGMFEIDWIYGQLIFTMFFISQYIVYHKEPEQLQPKKKQEKKLSDVELPKLEIVEL